MPETGAKIGKLYLVIKNFDSYFCCTYCMLKTLCTDQTSHLLISSHKLTQFDIIKRYLV